MSNLFRKSVNKLPLQILIFIGLTVGIVTAGITYYATPKYTRVGYAPTQPVPFSHALHAGQLGVDCRFCHVGVDKSGVSSVPSAQTCMNCHSIIKTDSPLLAPVRESYATGNPVPWVKVHQVPDYVYFNHSVHIARGVSCVECHGQINEMDTLQHAKPLSMGWCLECHRAPETVLRDPKLVTDLNWKHPGGVDAQIEQGKKFVHDWKVQPPQSCSGCHR
ncbi:MAG: hypothetical protein RL376_1765 [Verrucomicrobiota bacterium]|jgi:hypothetical protein